MLNSRQEILHHNAFYQGGVSFKECRTATTRIFEMTKEDYHKNTAFKDWLSVIDDNGRKVTLDERYKDFIYIKVTYH